MAFKYFNSSQNQTRIDLKYRHAPVQKSIPERQHGNALAKMVHPWLIRSLYFLLAEERLGSRQAQFFQDGTAPAQTDLMVQSRIKSLSLLGYRALQADALLAGLKDFWVQIG